MPFKMNTSTMPHKAAFSILTSFNLKTALMCSATLIMLGSASLSPSYAQEAKPVAATAKQIKAQKLLAAKAKNEAAIKKADEALNKITLKLLEISLHKKELEQQKKSLKPLLRSREVTTLPTWIQSPIFKRLFAKQYRLRNEFETAKISLLPAHPRYKRLKARSTALNKDIHNELAKIHIRLKQDLASTTRQETRLEENLKSLKSKVAAAKKDQLQLQALSKRAELSLISAQKITLEERTELLNTALEEHGQNLLTSEPKSSPRLVQLLDQYTDMSMNLAELSTKWSARHPRIRQVQRHLNQLQHKIANMARKDILELDVMAQSLGDKEEALLKETEALEEQKQAKLEMQHSDGAAQQNPTQNNGEQIKTPNGGLSLAYERKPTETLQPDTTSLMRN